MTGDFSGEYYAPIVIGTMEFWSPLFFLLGFHFFFFFVAMYRKDNGLIDVAWGLDFIIANVVIIVIRCVNGGVKENLDVRSIICNILVTIWGLRMAMNTVLRTEMGKEDRRFAKIREKLMIGGGPILFYCVSFFGVWMTNTLIILAIASSSLYVSMFSSKASPIGVLDIIGIVIWLIGFTIVTVADHQLRKFKILRAQDLTGGQRLLKEGLWAYSRHPNYFGESLLWWGIYLMACSVDDDGWKTIWSPILIFLCIRFLSGVPTVEGLYENEAEFKLWCQTTNVFVPLPRKKIVADPNYDDMNNGGKTEV